MGLSLSVRALEVTSDRNRRLLSVPALEAPAGALIGVRGASGAGKSTLLYALAGLLERASGSVRWGDTDLLSLAPERRAGFRAGQIGMIFQDFLLFEELDALANASVTALFRKRPERAALRTRSAERLSRLGLDAGARSVASFSGGERQRVAIARAMAAEAPILLADEPTASLDRAAADRLIEDLVAMTRETGTTLVAVSHDMHLIARMDRVLTVTDGALSADEVPA
ncbi:MAG: ABC transporter ATP-binding protein [Rhodobacteraceae bacterium]|jgi:ABC-type lipoprotein export system ATPase subunit|uniref:Putative ABC transport system ATP-binding protein n=1 Tax=Salipiger profundus TaxID=1229727 RepID=A0A1U7D7F9_9RHOB|nr:MULTISPECIES: ATP-binding cassette domain-containing protein [Salipiger]APX24091.1 putative ABC transport system ATP-binding protein [Salipiger profundus]MAB06882.1 ABC transporter ATP-binding protein [Paracoccaceae bacterium]GFZ94586.1 ABC transporter ATP-binding protein [Salipiger profundus]SFB91387.1 putative ABC transport system ATP-binding protein [Salipiger profundus]